MTDQELLDRILLDEIRLDRKTLAVRIYHRGHKRFVLKKPDQHPRDGRFRFRFGRKRRTVYRNRLVWMIINRRMPPERVDHKNDDRLDDRPENLGKHTAYQSARQGFDVQTVKALEECLAYFDYIYLFGEEPC